MSATPAPTLKLKHGALMPQLGIGTSPMSNREAERAIVAAVERGYRMIDTASAYGNEVGVGRGIAGCGLPREELFITTKLGGEFHGEQEAVVAWEQSAARLDVDYIDLFLIHWPLPRSGRYVDAWRGLTSLLSAGRARAIGTSNFKPSHLERLLSATGVSPDVNQIQLSPYTTREAPRAFHAAHEIATQSWGPLGVGRDDLGNPISTDLLTDPVIAGIARHYGKTPAQVVLKWHVSLGLSAVAKSQSPRRMTENIGLWDFELQADDIARISNLDRGESLVVDSDEVGS